MEINSDSIQKGLLFSTAEVIKKTNLSYENMYCPCFVMNGGDKDIFHKFKNFKAGLSKLVLTELSSNYVVKIPIRGYYLPEEDSKFNLLYDENGLAIVSKVEYQENYCDKEIEVYANAVIAGLAECFAGSWYLGEVDDFPIYYQEKVKDIGDSTSKASEKEIEELQCSDRDFGSIESLPFISDFINYYGEETFDRLINFLESELVGDLHEGNIGYIDGRPVLVDYSGFES